MKQSILLAVAIIIATSTFGQSEKYLNAMKQNIALVDSLMIKANAAEMANTFYRIAEAEKDKWLPYYYAAYCKVTQAMTEQDNSKKDALADKATEYLSKAEAMLGKENSEVNVIKSLIATAHMMVDPQSRFMTYGPQSTEFIKKSEKLDPTNPRPILLEAQNTYYTPEAFGGGKEAAKPLFVKANVLFENFKPETDFSPFWGKPNVAYFLSQYK